MADKTIKTRIQILNDSAENLEAKKTSIPLAGEIVYDQTNHKMKIGDGNTALGDLKFVGGDAAQNFDVTPNEGEDDIAAITRVVDTAELHDGDTAIVKRAISGDKYSYTAYVYDGAWKAMDGNYSADNVYFNDDLTYTANIGVKTVPSSGSGTIEAAGKNVKEVLASILAKEQNPTVTKPSVNLTNTGFGQYEIGTKKNLTWNASLSAGSYQYGPATGITATGWTISLTGEPTTYNTATGTFEDVVATAMPKTITAEAAYTQGAIPKTNLGNEYAAGRIPAGSASKNSTKYQGVRYMFWGPMTKDEELNSTNIRALKSCPAGAGDLTSAAVAGAIKVIVAVPSNRSIKTVLLTSAMNADITSTFVKQNSQIDVEGANGYTAEKYNVYVYQPASIDPSETYAITIA